MQYIFGSKEKQAKKIDLEFGVKMKNMLKKQYCEICKSNFSNKVAFGDEVKPTFCCSTCELKAVGGAIRRLGERNLLVTDSFADIFTKELINYQCSLTSPTLEEKAVYQTGDNLLIKTKQINTSILDQFKQLKQQAKTKAEELILKAKRENSFSIFEETNQLLAQKKQISEHIGQSMAQHCQATSKGISFLNESELQLKNENIQEQFTTLRNFCQTDLKQIYSLTEKINQMII